MDLLASFDCSSQINLSYQECTRWEEASCVVKTIACLSHASRAPTEIRLLDKSDSFVVDMESSSENSQDKLLSHLSIDPGERKSIGTHIPHIIERLKDIDDELHATKKIAVLIIITDTESGEENIVENLKILEGLPIKIVIRICSEESRTVDHWHSISAQLDLDVDIIGHVKTEATQITENNNWLTYAEPLHCLREYGIVLPAINDMNMQQLPMHNIWTLARIL